MNSYEKVKSDVSELGYMNSQDPRNQPIKSPWKTVKNNLKGWDSSDVVSVYDKAGNVYYSDPKDLCKCPPAPPCHYKGPTGSADFKCLDQEGKNGCEPGKTRHDKARNLAMKEHAIAEDDIVAAAGVQHGHFNDKSMTFNGRDNQGHMEEGKGKEAKMQLQDDNKEQESWNDCQREGYKNYLKSQGHIFKDDDENTRRILDIATSRHSPYFDPLPRDPNAVLSRRLGRSPITQTRYDETYFPNSLC